MFSVQDRHVNMSICPSSRISFTRGLNIFSLAFSHFLFFLCFFSFQQHTGERKQMAKAIAAVNKTPKTSTFKKRSSTPATPAPPPKRRSFQPTAVTCYNCHQPGHIAPRCPSRSPAFSTPAPKAVPKK